MPPANPPATPMTKYPTADKVGFGAHFQFGAIKHSAAHKVGKSCLCDVVFN